ncbi:MAG TPA: glutamate--cysteine ligase, partial [Candidatus Berkiella sp.]|nr:glutamate--cysteine ligase [Candidatus Berkiella sp.]
LGWSVRSKTQHCIFYQKICENFAKLIDIDVWQICPLFTDHQEIDFIKREGIDALIEKADSLLKQIQHKYHQYNIEFTPFVVIKADAGTYGMGVMPIHDPQQLKTLNRKQRMSMSVRKGGKSVERVIIQEGIPTFETIGIYHNVAEPVVYMLGQHVIGGFYRVHQERDIFENLNSPGMHFEKLSFAACCNNPDNRLSPHDAQNQFYVYGVIARLAALAISYEKSALLQEYKT